MYGAYARTVLAVPELGPHGEQRVCRRRKS